MRRMILPVAFLFAFSWLALLPASHIGLFAAQVQAAAPDQWDRGDEWRAEFKVGDQVQFTVSGREADFQTCTVTTNEPGFPMRVECKAFKQWSAGSYIVYGKSSIRSLKSAGPEKETKRAGSHPSGDKQPSAATTWDSGDEWRGEFKVGDKIQFSISGKSADFQTCTVTENDPDRVMRVKCGAFKQWDAGTYIVHAKYYVRTKDGEAKRKEPEPAFNPGKPNNTQTAAAPTSLPGTYWQLLSMTKKGQAVKELSARPDVEFCRSGEWGILHYGGRREAGSYKVTGNRLVMRYEGGELYGNYRIARQGNIMELDDGEYVLRLRYVGPAGRC